MVPSDLVIFNAGSDRLQDNESSVTSERAFTEGVDSLYFLSDCAYGECFLQRLTSLLTAAMQSCGR